MLRATVGAVVVASLALAGCGSSAAPKSAAGPTTSAAGATTSVAPPTSATVPPSTSPSTSMPPVPPNGLGAGDRGPQVQALEARLSQLHFDVGTVDDRFDDDTTYGVQAFEKATGLPRDGRATQAVIDRLATAQPEQPKNPGGGATRVEIDLGRQLLFLYENDSLEKILTVSTGTGERFCAKGRCGIANTPTGAFRVDYMKQGWDISPLGRLYNPVYFDSQDGIAIHGFPEVPPEPASHGCVRIPMSAAEWFPPKVPPGTPVFVQ